jgi:HK97 family phage major capsid protein
MSDTFKNNGEYFQAVARSMTPGNPLDHRLITAAATGLNETAPSDGGFLVNSDLHNQIMQQIFSPARIAARCRRFTISGNSNSIRIPGLDETSRAAGSRHGGVQGYWVAEAGQLTGTKPKFRQVELVLKKQIVMVYATDELLSDSRILADYLSKVAADELTFGLEDAIVNGSGAGQPLGILNSGCLATVAPETGQAADTLVAENIMKMWSRMLGSSRPNSVWLINQNVEPQLYSMALSVGTGGAPIFLPGGGMSEQPYATLYGRPIIPCEHCPTLGDLGDIILADFGGYLLAQKGGIESAMSIHVKFDYDESVFRFVMRVDGQPALSSAVTPYKGGDTLSHFVALAAR